jgi:hypothetical protein
MELQEHRVLQERQVPQEQPALQALLVLDQEELLDSVKVKYLLDHVKQMVSSQFQ